ncbi:hypothetical protein NET02_09910 [Thermomicrobiaceae bacterium CFH 74404]|uniref:Uncharacterized protein n=2 Tax=Thermomicrobia TaxID=189775 RepID=A0AA42BAA0_9BACT|nr:hypothetical protein [Thermalbibacter longus]MCM8749462.1 hypothetical protein [Thermalbibacter longus]
MKGQRRRCARPGCRAWAMRGHDFCRMHRTGGREPPSRDEALLRGRLEERIAAMLEQAGSAQSLAEEIGALRLVLARVLAEEDDPERLATSIPRIVDTVVRAVRAQRALSGVMAEHLTEALTQVLIELGLGEE